MIKKHQQIIVMGGGGSSMEPDNLALDRYIINHARQRTPQVCFLPTASGDAQGYIDSFYNSFQSLDCVPKHVSLFRGSFNWEKTFLESDVIYVGGGNTKNMLLLWQEWGILPMLKQALDFGTILCGLSAGAICWFEEGLTDSVPGSLNKLDCLGYLQGSCSPHYNSEPQRRPKYEALINAKMIKPGFGIDDSVALHFIDQKLEITVASKHGVNAYYYDSADYEHIEKITPVIL